MRRRDFIGGIGAAASIWPRRSVALQNGVRQKKMPRIGLLLLLPPPEGQPVQDAFAAGLRENGLIEGQNITIDRRFWNADRNKLARDIAKFVSSAVDTILAPSTAEAIAASSATSKIPIVTVTADAVAAGLADSLARPGRNVTGLSGGRLDKQLPLLSEAVPSASRFAILLNPDSPFQRQKLPILKDAAERLNLELLFVEKRTAGDIDPAFAIMHEKQAQALVVLSDPITFANRREIIELAARDRIPAIYTWLEEALDGGLLAYGPDINDLFRRAAGYVAKLLRGEKAAELPIEQAERIHLVVNLRTAKALGLQFHRHYLRPPTRLSNNCGRHVPSRPN